MDPERHFDVILETMKRVVATLNDEEIPFVLGGSLAAWALGGPRSDNDLDIVVKPEDAERALDALVRAGMSPERPPEEWLLKAHDEDVTVDLIFAPSGVEITDELIESAEEMEVMAVPIRVLAPEDLLCSKLLSLHEHHLDLEPVLQIARAIREQVDWAEVERRTRESPYAQAFMTLARELALVEEGEGPTRRVARSGALTRAELHPAPSAEKR